MKRIVCLAVALVLLCSPVAYAVDTESEETSFPYSHLAVLRLGSSAEGSIINYFVVRPVVCYTSESGVTSGTMFDAVVFATDSTPKTPVEAENFITALFSDGENLDAVNSAVGDLKSGGFVSADYKYPVFVELPYYYDVFADGDERLSFCEYFIITFSAVLKQSGLDNIAFAGISFGTEYDNVPDFRKNCASVVKEKGLLSIAFSAVGSSNYVDACFAASEGFSSRLQLAKNADGIVMRLNGVPDVNDDKVLMTLKNELSTFEKTAFNQMPVAFEFNAFSDLYECAAALEETVPNKNARDAYDLIAETLTCDKEKDESSLEESSEASDVSEESGRTANGIEYFLYAAISLVALACFVYVVYILVKKGVGRTER